MNENKCTEMKSRKNHAQEREKSQMNESKKKEADTLLMHAPPGQRDDVRQAYLQLASTTKDDLHLLLI